MTQRYQIELPRTIRRIPLTINRKKRWIAEGRITYIMTHRDYLAHLLVPLGDVLAGRGLNNFLTNIDPRLVPTGCPGPVTALPGHEEADNKP